METCSLRQIPAASAVRGELDRRVLLAGTEIHDLPCHSRQYRRDWIDAQHRLPEAADDLVGDAKQALIAAAAEEEAQDRNLAEHVVQSVEGNEGPAHAHLGCGIDVAFAGAADRRPLQHAFALRELPVFLRRYRASPRERHAVLHARPATRAKPTKL